MQSYEKIARLQQITDATQAATLQAAVVGSRSAAVLKIMIGYASSAACTYGFT